MFDQPTTKSTAAVLAAAGEPTRLMLLHLLRSGPMHVGRLAELVGMPQVNVSHHLGVLRIAGLLDDEKLGRRVVYRLRPDLFTPPGTIQVGRYKLHFVPQQADAAEMSNDECPTNDQVKSGLTRPVVAVSS